MTTEFRSKLMLTEICRYISTAEMFKRAEFNVS